ncbi:hypothetical protein [Agromyces mangrovi Wang et al. 2018]|uniref:hypothetical protein n=1 Tax=Agromyces mangrovi TaxID=1858653 RepID=UPI0025739BA5|nr:hypothetical protein [Agromyces mangrovi]
MMADRAVVGLFDFAASAAGARQGAHVELPIVDVDGSTGTMRAVIGPASQILARRIDDGSDDPDVEAFVADLGERALPYGHARAVPDSGHPLPDIDLE